MLLAGCGPRISAKGRGRRFAGSSYDRIPIAFTPDLFACFLGESDSRSRFLPGRERDGCKNRAATAQLSLHASATSGFGRAVS